MKKYILLLLSVMVGSVLSSCEDDDFQHQKDFERSYQKWMDFKKHSGNTYYYITKSASWSGSHSKTKIVVANGIVVKREFEYTYYDKGQLVESESYSWTERGNELGTHDKGAGLFTLDEIYQKAKTEWLAKRGGVEYYFETKNDGMISSCGYVNEGCADDCFVGITITEIGVVYYED